MADGSIGAAVQEAIIPPVKDELGKALEAGVSAVMGKPQDPQKAAQEAQKKQQEEQKRIIWARATIERYRKLDDEMQRLRMQKQQDDHQKKQTEAQEKQDAQVKLQHRNQQSNQIVRDAQTRTEVKKGLGG